MFCPNCGTKNDDAARFCGNCGRPFSGQAAPPQAGTATAPVAAQKPLQYQIFGENLPAVSIRLDTGESIYTQSGGMTWMDAGITMETNMKGGLGKSLGRMFTGESLFMATYTATRPNQEIVIASTFPGNIAPLQLNGNTIIAQKSAFLCAQPEVTLSAYVTRGLKAGLFGGEGFVLQRLTGHGTAMIEIDGSLSNGFWAPVRSGWTPKRSGF